LLTEAPPDLTRILRSFFAAHLAEKRLDIDQFVKAQAALNRALGQTFGGEVKESAASGFLELQSAVASGKERFEAFGDWQLNCFASFGLNWKQMVWLLNKALAELVCDAGMKLRTRSVPVREQRRQVERQVAKRQDKERRTREIHVAKCKEFQREMDLDAEKEQRMRTETILKDIQRDEFVYQKKKEFGLRMLKA
jgi:hypothetical protein